MSSRSQGRDDVVVAIDGPSGSGKSTIARGVAVALGLRYLDTGAMYRAATWWVLQQAIDPADPSNREAVVSAVRGLVLVSGTDPRSPSIVVRPYESDPTDVSDIVRSPQVTAAVSAVSAIPEIRELLVAAQRIVIGDGGIVVEGRDIGTTVWPSAPVKVYLTASADARAHRRSSQDAAASPLAGAQATASQSAGDVDQVRTELARRDDFDSNRAVSPLAQAADAVVVDSTGLDIASVIDHVLRLVRSRTGIGSGDDLASRSDAEPFQRAVTLGLGDPTLITVIPADLDDNNVADLAELDDRVAR
jgi:cytidylate kinase